jgi:hypothetical protein
MPPVGFMQDQDIGLLIKSKRQSWDVGYPKKSPRVSIDEEVWTLEKTKLKHEISRTGKKHCDPDEEDSESDSSRSNGDSNSVDGSDCEALGRGKRGKYRKYSVKLKKNAIIKATELRDVSKAARILSVPIKNLKRWMTTGPIRRKGNIFFLPMKINFRWQENAGPCDGM